MLKKAHRHRNFRQIEEDPRTGLDLLYGGDQVFDIFQSRKGVGNEAEGLEIFGFHQRVAELHEIILLNVVNIEKMELSDFEFGQNTDSVDA